MEEENERSMLHLSAFRSAAGCVDDIGMMMMAGDSDEATALSVALNPGRSASVTAQQETYAARWQIGYP